MPPRGVLGKNTVEALQSGIIYGFAGQIDGLVERICDTVPGFDSDDLTVVATGSLAPLIYEECAAFTDHHPISPSTACVASTNVPARTPRPPLTFYVAAG